MCAEPFKLIMVSVGQPIISVTLYKPNNLTSVQRRHEFYAQWQQWRKMIQFSFNMKRKDTSQETMKGRIIVESP